MAFEHAGARVIGVDIGENPYAQLRISDNGDLPIVNGSQNYVVSFQVLEHIPVPNDYLGEAFRVLVPKGKLFLTTHGIWPYHPTPGDYHRWTVDGLSLELERAGFQIQSITYVLSEYSALVQNIVINADYHGMRNFIKLPVHLLAHLLISFLEMQKHHQVEIPAVICIVGVKQ